MSRDQFALSGIGHGGIEHGRASLMAVADQDLRWPGAMTVNPGVPLTISARSSATVRPDDGYVVFSASQATWIVGGSDTSGSLQARIATRPR
jgi:hypothetical protein